jgi:hypothetical protein
MSNDTFRDFRVFRSGSDGSVRHISIRGHLRYLRLLRVPVAQGHEETGFDLELSQESEGRNRGWDADERRRGRWEEEDSPPASLEALRSHDEQRR